MPNTFDASLRVDDGKIEIIIPSDFHSQSKIAKFDQARAVYLNGLHDDDA